MTCNPKTPDDFARAFNKKTGEAAYQCKHKKTTEKAIQDMVRQGISLSAAKKRIQKEVRHLADTQNAAEQQRQIAMGQAITAMQRSRGRCRAS